MKLDTSAAPTIRKSRTRKKCAAFTTLASGIEAASLPMMQLPALVNTRVPLKVRIQGLAGNFCAVKFLSDLRIELEAPTVVRKV